MEYWQTVDTRCWYQKPEILSRRDTGNWALIATDEDITVASCKLGSLRDVTLSGRMAFIALDEEELISGRGLEYFIETEIDTDGDATFGLKFSGSNNIGGVSPRTRRVPTAIFDNHNHALFFWAQALERGIIEKWATLVHIDMHSDLWENEYAIDPTRLHNLSYMASFTNLACNVGNYILPAQKVWLIGEMTRIEGESQLILARENLHRSPQILDENMILNLDLDIFAPNLDDISFELKREVILRYASKARYITIATSPFFIDEVRALEYLQRVFL